MANNRELAEFGKFVSVDNTTKNVGIATTVRITAGGLFVGAVQAIRPDGTWGGSSAGIQGAQGTGGVQGTTGTQGTTGAQGTTGTQGITGTQGATGSQGTTGAQGATGTQGTTGAQGTTGTQGTTGVQGIQGITGAGTQGTSGTLIVRAWVNFDGTGSAGVNQTIRNSSNVSSVSKSASGRYTINFSSALPSSSYAMAGAAARNDGTDDGNGAVMTFRRPSSSTRSTTACDVMAEWDGDFPDFGWCNCIFVN